MSDQPAQPKENKLEHPCFPQPADTSVRVWRYLDLSKFIWLLEYRKLYLSRLDLLNDPHEGSTPRLLAMLRDQQLREFGGEQLVAQIPNINQQSRKSLYINCWHLGNSESEAMWRLYCPGDSGVAIQTTYARLVASVDSDPFCYIGGVTYIDYETQGFPLNNLFYPVMHKRSSFAHEQEVRLVKTLSEYWGTPARESPAGVSIDWSPDSTIDSIYVNPYAPEFYYDVVRSIVRRVMPALEPQVHWSQMRAAPVY
jgi:hypothetical protein